MRPAKQIKVVREASMWVRERNASAGHSVGGWTTERCYEAEFEDGTTTKSVTLPPEWAKYLEQKK